MRWLGNGVQMEKCREFLSQNPQESDYFGDLHGDKRTLKLIQDKVQLQASETVLVG
jgi:hypothetical protein